MERSWMSDHRKKAIERNDIRRESVDLVAIAPARKAAIDLGEVGTSSLADMLSEFAPELLDEGEGSSGAAERPD